MKYDLAWLKRQYDSGDQPEFLFFSDTPSGSSEFPGPAVLTQWFPSIFDADGERYLHAAHWMMVQKARLFGDHKAVTDLFAVRDDQEIIVKGKQIVGFDQQRWDDHRYGIVMQGNLHKFSQHQALQSYISGTGRCVLTEANPSDKVWGIGLDESAPEASNPHLWKGLNLLGFALMEVRDALTSNAGASADL